MSPRQNHSTSSVYRAVDGMKSKPNPTRQYVHFIESYVDQRLFTLSSLDSTTIVLLGLRQASSLLEIKLECVKLVNDMNINYPIHLTAEEQIFYDQRAVKPEQFSTRIWRFPSVALPLLTGSGRIQLRVNVINTSNQDHISEDILLSFIIIPPLEQHKPKYNFTLCLSPTFGDISHNRFVEFIEMNRILGADHIYVYDYDASHKNSLLNDSMKYYSSSAGDHLISVIPWRLPPPLTRQSVYYAAQFVAIQHCLYKAMLESRFTLFYDLDELLIPHVAADKDDSRPLTWTDMVQTMNFHKTSDKICGACFKMNFLLYQMGKITQKDVEAGTAGNVSKVVYFRNLDRTYSHPYNNKCLTRTIYVTSMSVHQIDSCLPHWQQKVYGSDVAIIQHYYETFCLNPHNAPTRWCQFEMSDNTIMKYSKLFFERKSRLPHAMRL